MKQPYLQSATVLRAVGGIALVVLVSGWLLYTNGQGRPLNPKLAGAKWAAKWIADPATPAKLKAYFTFAKN